MDKITNNLIETLDKLNECVKRGDFASGKQLIAEANEAFEECSKNDALNKQIMKSRFGTLNHILENKMGGLLMIDKDAIGQCIATIINDKNLVNEARFYHALSLYDGSGDARDYLTEALSFMKGKVNGVTLAESTKKLASVMSKNGLNDIDGVTDEYEKFTESCDYLLCNSKKLSNINEFERHMNVVSNYINEHKAEKVDKTLYEECDRFSTQLGQLNESERSLVDIIIDSKAEFADERRKELFEKYKNECLKSIDKVISESDKTDKERLMNIREQISSKVYNGDTIVKDMAKFLEIGTLLGA